MLHDPIFRVSCDNKDCDAKVTIPSHHDNCEGWGTEEDVDTYLRGNGWVENVCGKHYCPTHK